MLPASGLDILLRVRYTHSVVRCETLSSEISRRTKSPGPLANDRYTMHECTIYMERVLPDNLLFLNLSYSHVTHATAAVQDDGRARARDTQRLAQIH